MDKPFKTYDELLDFLESKKELAVPDRDYARKILAKISYLNFVKFRYNTHTNKRYLRW